MAEFSKLTCTLIGMIQAITHMRVLNKPFVIQMSNSSSVEFLQFSSVFEDDVSI